ncbi:BQ2448_433 [Microbotryum intermedium]|uniref:BQ2448_433 protein n=1 Tax=Microbotryum intermedium TaxID=269621 RepID=A0A238F2F3_9BASI|nr:BQ2448_433 [Microbotryum intermedium]
MQNMGKSVMRVAKNSIKGFSEAQTKVRDATSNDPWGPSGTQMSEIAALTFNPNDFVEIIEMLDKRLNDKGKNWRHVFKSLTLLDYILHNGSENVVQYFRENIYIVKTLKEFQYIDEFGKDQGANVRQKAKDITNLLLDDRRMKSQRATRRDMRSRMSGAETRPKSSDSRPDRSGARSGDGDFEAAIAASKRSAEEEAKRNQADNDLEEAMRLSREEDERRRRELAQSGSDGLFDEQRQNQNNLIDINFQPQQPMQTGWASFNPYAAQQQAMLEEKMRQAQMMELQRQQQEQQQFLYAQQQAQLQAQYAQQQQQEEYTRQQQYMYQQQMAQQQQALQPQPTAFGANNPFAAFAAPPQQQQQPQTTFNDNFASATPPRQPSPPPAMQPQQTAQPARQRPPKDDGKHAELAKVLAGGREDGLDTFGNVGNMRIPVGAQFATRTGGTVQAQPTGLARPNPFNISKNPTQNQQKEQPFFTI